MIFFVCRLAVGMQSAARPTLALSSRAVLFHLPPAILAVATALMYKTASSAQMRLLDRAHLTDGAGPVQKLIQ
ncbi:hypothetical protein EAY64_20080 [Aquitalea palustris]|uniref:Uncharacterized protein n=1 Tax=Aquitalea palustris TaxID=2480983 RepID=A0A454JCV9_9NEIS|nr:hypothetical protein EAY64_20080 [Aquitalea palustris]